MVRPISQSSELRLRRRPESKNAYTAFYSVAYGARSYSPTLGRWINRDPIGERGGENVYVMSSNEPIGRCDRLGLKVFVLYVSPHGKKAEEDTTERTLGSSFKRIDKLLKDMEDVSDKMFEEGKRLGRIKLNGNNFAGTKTEFIQIIKEEKQSKIFTLRNSGKTKVLNKLKSIAKLANKDYDIVATAIHGGMNVDHMPANMICYGNEEWQDTDKAIEEIRNTGRPITGNLLIASCFRTWPGKGDPKDFQEGFGINGYSGSGKVSFGGKVIIKGTEEKFVKTSCSIWFKTFSIYKSVGGKRIKGSAQYENFSK